MSLLSACLAVDPVFQAVIITSLRTFPRSLPIHHHHHKLRICLLDLGLFFIVATIRISFLASIVSLPS